MKQTLQIIALLILLNSCSQMSPTIESQFQSSINANSESTTHTDWENSNFHPRFIFESLRQQLADSDDEVSDKKIKKEICTGLKNLSDDTLLIFENEIRNDENTDLLAGCQAFLLTKLNNKNDLSRIHFQYSTNAISNEPSNIDFTIKTKILRNIDFLSLNKYDANMEDKEVILTFDDGPHSEFTSSILRTLKEAGDAKAMFFQLGKQIEKYPEETIQVNKEGHLVANHSWDHLCLDSTESCKTNNKGKILTDDEVSFDIMSTFYLIKKTIGKAVPFFRYPYGASRTTTSKYLKDYGIHEMHWNIDSNDWRYIQKVGTQNLPFTSKEVMASALRTLDKSKKGVVLFHDIHRRTAELLPQFLYELHKRGFKLVIFDSTNKNIEFEEAKNISEE